MNNFGNGYIYLFFSRYAESSEQAEEIQPLQAGMSNRKKVDYSIILSLQDLPIIIIV
jgi:hypothetical protein